jgi:hypothetical protein
MSEPTHEQIDCVAQAIVDDNDLWQSMTEPEHYCYRLDARRYILAFLSCPPPDDNYYTHHAPSRGRRYS